MMGYIRHDAIVVTSWNEKHLRKAAEEAERLGLNISSFVESGTNHYVSFLITPDGSKEGWPASNAGDEAREDWKEWANAAYKKGVYVDWAHLSYAGDEHSDTKIIDQASKIEN